MSTAPSSTPPAGQPARRLPALVRAIRGLAWGALLVVLAASGAGLAGFAWHAPGTPARAELTYAGDTALGGRLDTATAELRVIVDDVARLAAEAKVALEDVSSFDPARLEASLARGGALADSIDARARSLRASLVDLPGNEPDAILHYAGATLVRRANVLGAIEAAQGLAANWRAVRLRAADTNELTALITAHNTTVINATEEGRNGRYKLAAEAIGEALVTIEAIETLRRRLVADPGETVLDEWISRTEAYDVALQNLYLALRASKGKVTIEVQAARREERIAFENLPPDGRTILVIIAEVTRGGLTQAVLAIEEAHGRLEAALATTAP